ncbi:MAG: LLM class F420-dependent oxidoreductase [Actinobacteria bacterium]|nr:LLM class F420-dependent oxidoreductase [Actinomycetota bacterium]
MHIAITLGRLNPVVWVDAVTAADELGYESVWLPEHLVLPLDIQGQLVPGEEHPPVPPTTPVYDAPAYLSYLAGITSRIRLGTFVYLLGLRHPFVSARGFATLDVVSGGRAEVGVGAGWLETEWEAVGLDPSTRGRRLDEAIDVCKRLWTEPEIEYHGEFFDFLPVAFEPKPVQHPHPPIVIGGESDRALRRVAERGDGWIGMAHTPGSVAPRVERLAELLEAAGRDRRGVTVTVMGEVSSGDALDAYAAAGVDRLIVVPWQRSSEAVSALETFAARHL